MASAMTEHVWYIERLGEKQMVRDTWYGYGYDYRYRYMYRYRYRCLGYGLSDWNGILRWGSNQIKSNRIGTIQGSHTYILIHSGTFTGTFRLLHARGISYTHINTHRDLPDYTDARGLPYIYSETTRLYLYP